MNLGRTSMQHETILLVEDDAEILELTKLFLERAGYRVVTAADGQEGLRMYQQHRSDIDMLFTDVTMPNMNGIDLACCVAQLDAGLPILFMSGDTAGLDQRFCCLHKPFTRRELISSVDRALDLSQRRQMSERAR